MSDSDTPRTDKAAKESTPFDYPRVMRDLASTLHRELAAERKLASEYKALAALIEAEARAAAIADAEALCRKLADKWGAQNGYIAHALESKISALATAPAEHVCVPVDLSYAQLKAIAIKQGTWCEPSEPETEGGVTIWSGHTQEQADEINELVFKDMRGAYNDFILAARQK